jgi:hypothetical protein
LGGSVSPALHRIIEVEPSVHIINGQSSGIVQVRANKIVGRLDQAESSTSMSSGGPGTLSSSADRLTPPPGRERGSHRSGVWEFFSGEGRGRWGGVCDVCVWGGGVKG